MSSLASTDDVEPCAPGAPAAGLVQLRPISIDDWSDVRYVHETSFSTFIGPRASCQSVDEFMTCLAAPDYVDQLGGADLVGAWLDGQLVGTAGWHPMDSAGRVARIEGLFVLPLFAFMGVGSLLLADAEARARRAGYAIVTALAASVSIPFFMRSGYDVYAQGPGVSDFAGDLPVFVMRKQVPVMLTVSHGAGVTSLQPAAVAEEELLPGLMRRAVPRARRLFAED